MLGTDSDAPARPQRLMKVSDGGSFGELGFFLKRPQVRACVCTTALGPREDGGGVRIIRMQSKSGVQVDPPNESHEG